MTEAPFDFSCLTRRGVPVQHFDAGEKIFLEDDSWILFRQSGTEPSLRVYGEAPTQQAIDDLIATTWGPAWERTWVSFRALPASVVERALRALSPQWFFMLERPAS